MSKKKDAVIAELRELNEALTEALVEARAERDRDRRSHEVTARLLVS